MLYVECLYTNCSRTKGTVGVNDEVYDVVDNANRKILEVHMAEKKNGKTVVRPRITLTGGGGPDVIRFPEQIRAIR